MHALRHVWNAPVTFSCEHGKEHSSLTDEAFPKFRLLVIYISFSCIKLSWKEQVCWKIMCILSLYSVGPEFGSRYDYEICFRCYFLRDLPFSSFLSRKCLKWRHVGDILSLPHIWNRGTYFGYISYGGMRLILPDEFNFDFYRTNDL